MSYLINQYFYAPRQIYLNSRFATSTPDPLKNNHCYFAIETINIPNAYDNLLVSVDDAQIPVSFYAINETNNTINIGFYSHDNSLLYPDFSLNGPNRGHDPGYYVGPYMKTYTIPAGNYDAYTLSNALTILVKNDLILNSLNVSITCVYDEAVNKFIFDFRDSNTSSNYRGLWISFPDGTFGASVWGLNSGKNQDGTIRYSYSFDNPLIAPYCCDLAGSRFAFVQCPTFGTSNVNSKTGSTNQILAKIPITQDYLTIQQFVNNGYVNKIHNNKSITVIEIRILDENLNDINFNGVNWSLSMTISILGRPPEEMQMATVNV